MIRYIVTAVAAVASVFTSVMATGAQGMGPVTFPTTIENHGTYLHLSGGTNYQPLPAGAPVPGSASFHATRDGQGIVTTRNYHTMTASHQTAPVSQAIGPNGVPLDVLARTDPNVVVTRESLPAAQCTQLLSAAKAKSATLPANACDFVHYSYGVNHQAVPAGTTGAVAIASGMDPGYWYWSFWDEVTDVTGGNVWKFHLNEDGEANGQHVYQWHTNCTPSGLGTSISWCGYFYNGGGAPNYGMQFGLDGKVCIGIGPAQYCYAHGIRRWIDDSGNPSTVNTW